MQAGTALSRARRTVPEAAALYVRLLRPRQWVKSGFVIAPLIFSMSFVYPDRVAAGLFAALLMSLASSAAYVWNDLLDREADTRHPEKRLRPIAAGVVSVREAGFLIGCLLVAVACGTAAMPKIAPGVLGYLLLAVAYTKYLKHWVWIDIVALTAVFVVRVETGILAIDVPPSPWMLSATASLALYLAAVKRREELRRIGSDARMCLKHYTVAQLDAAKLLGAMAAASSYAVFAATVRPVLIPTIAFVILGIARFEWRTRENGGESTAEVVLHDPLLIACILLWAVAAGFALLQSGIAA